jgi:hypothetical protein
MVKRRRLREYALSLDARHRRDRVLPSRQMSTPSNFTTGRMAIVEAPATLVHVARERRVREQQRSVPGEAMASRPPSAVVWRGAEHGDSVPQPGAEHGGSLPAEAGRTLEFRACGSIPRSGCEGA